MSAETGSSYDEESSYETDGSSLSDVDRGNTLFGVIIIAHFGLPDKPMLPPIFSHNRITYVHATPMGTEYSAFKGSFNRWRAEVDRFYKFGAESDPNDDLALNWQQHERDGFITGYKTYLNDVLENQVKIGKQLRAEQELHLEEWRLEQLRLEDLPLDKKYKSTEASRKLKEEKVKKDESRLQIHKGIMNDLKNIFTHITEYFGVRSIGGDQAYQFQSSEEDEILQEGEKYDSVYFNCLRDCDHMPEFIHSLPKTLLGYDLFTEECVAGFEEALELAKQSKADLVNPNIIKRNEKIDDLKDTLRYVFSCRAKRQDGSWYWQTSANFDALDIFQLFLCVSNEVIALTYGCEAFDDVQDTITHSDRETRILTIMEQKYDTEAERIFSTKGTPAGKMGRRNIPSFRARGAKKPNRTHRKTKTKANMRIVCKNKSKRPAKRIKKTLRKFVHHASKYAKKKVF